MTPKTLGPAENAAFDFIGFFPDQKHPFGPALVRLLVRLVQSWSAWSKISEVSENKAKKLDQNWTKTGPSTVLVRSPGFSGKSRGGSGSGSNARINHGANAMTNPQRPRRRNKGDRLIYSGASQANVQCDYAVGPLDALALEMDRKWGIDRLPELVSTETATRYGQAIAQLNEALASQDPKTAAHKAQVCMKGLRIMDVEAEANGAPKADGAYWEYELGNFKFAIIEDGREWQTLKAKRPDLMFFTMREAANALKAYCEVLPLQEIKTAMPGAQVQQFPKVSAELKQKVADGGDDIPF